VVIIAQTVSWVAGQIDFKVTLIFFRLVKWVWKEETILHIIFYCGKSHSRLAAVRQLIYGFNVTTRTWLLNLLEQEVSCVGSSLKLVVMACKLQNEKVCLQFL
jgi:hypothetical protein